MRLSPGVDINITGQNWSQPCHVWRPLVAKWRGKIFCLGHILEVQHLYIINVKHEKNPPQCLIAPYRP